ncbi:MULTISPECIES: LysM peptidoglycan-binding domain-containing protein [Winogradskyella]|uniref:LysM peptidoglycan-binding domain-containing protein n=1 Tax=Winogradskyella TaxID=286104 RepID=UPI0015C83277|nr:MULTISPECIES: LysM peptidoglycan-binding domain-containing protein [Winogradskyella]QXP79469.1 LysM peptidoglycan-binding domain-containing protein [Winogradskyella sp. HaHa_3_26]
MQKSFKLIVTFLINLIACVQVIAQEETNFKDVILDGEPAIFDVVTGEITVVKLENIVSGTKIDSVNTSSIYTKKSGVNEILDSNIVEFHSVKEGETLLDLSKKYKVSLTELMRANKLETTLIDVGQKLWVKNLDFQLYPIKEAVVKEKSAASSLGNLTSNFYIVKSGNTLYGISNQFHLSVQKLKRINNLNSNLIRVGKKLRVKSLEIKNQTKNNPVYVVKRGDNLYRIALNNGITVKIIKELNGLTSDLIIIGQKLKLN